MDDSSTTPKQCRVCKQFLPANTNFFSPDKTSRDGWRGDCKHCRNAHLRTDRLAKKPIAISLPPVPEGYKRCRDCEQVKPATTEFFNKTALYQSSDGLNKQCRECRMAYRKKHTQNKPLTANPQTSTKQCHECGQSFPATSEFFVIDRATKDCLRVFCKICSKSKLREYRASPDGKEKRQVYRQSRREADKVYRKNYHRQHRDRDRAYHFTYRIQHADRIRARAKQYRQTHTHEKRIQTLHRIARKKQASGSYTATQIRDLYRRQRGRCYYCKKPFLVGKNAYHIDHVVPLSRGGSNDISNIVLACPPCNLSKGNKLLHEWIDGGRLL